MEQKPPGVGQFFRSSQLGLLCCWSFGATAKCFSWYLGMGQNLLVSILMGWTSIYQLFCGSLGTRVMTHSHLGTPGVFEPLLVPCVYCTHGLVLTCMNTHWNQRIMTCMNDPLWGNLIADRSNISSEHVIGFIQAALATCAWSNCKSGVITNL